MNLELIPEHTGDWYISALKELHGQLMPATYFEIGTANGDTLALADCVSAAVDPAFKITRDVVGRKPACFFFQLTSDEFFGRHDLKGLLGNSVSIAFLDGMHHFEYLLRDFINTEKHCGSGSVIVLHDCLPTDTHVARRDSEDLSLAGTSRHPGWWAGDVWKAAAIIRRLRPELIMFGVNVPPTGLIAIANLNRHSEVLQNCYESEAARSVVDLEQDNEFADFANSLPRFSSSDLTNGGWLKRLFPAEPGASNEVCSMPHNCKISPQEDEALVERHEFALWPEQLQRTFLSAREIRPSRRAAVVVAMRDDGVSMLEWVAHYRVLGFEGIFVYSGNNSDGSDEMLRLLAAADVLTFIENRTTGRFSPQRKAFEHSIRLLPELRDFEWVFYADSDEFLDLPRHDQNVIGMLDNLAAHFPAGAPSAICYRWKWFISNNVFARESGLLLTRFQHCTPHRSFKSMVRLRDVVSMCRLHFPDTSELGFFVDSNFEVIPESRNADDMWGYANAAIRNEGGYVRHYWTKSFEEFAIKKRRGDTLNLADNPYQRDFRSFFEWNGPELPENKDAPADMLVQGVEREIRWLKQIPGVDELDRRLQADFPRLLEALGGPAVLRQSYEEHRRLLSAEPG